jgi:aconitate hydratase 2/2-methylisocitrate dehydratase
MQMGDEIALYPYEGKIINANGETISTFKLTPNTIPDEVRAGRTPSTPQALPTIFCAKV